MAGKDLGICWMIKVLGDKNNSKGEFNMEMNQLLVNEVEQFEEVLHSFKLNFYCEFTLRELRDNNDNWINWKNELGIYVFIQGNDIKYIGRSLINGLGSRVSDQINSFGNPDWDDVINNDYVRIGLICLKQNDWFIAAALEAFLINLFRPEFNKRIA